MRKALALAALVGLVAAPAMAQQHTGHGAGQEPTAQGGMRGQGMMGGMMGQGGEEMGPLTAQLGKYAPAKVLAMTDHLSLSAEQEAQITALGEAGKKAERDAHEPAHTAHMELNKVMASPEPDTAVLRQLFMAHHMAEGNMQWIRATTAMQVRALLTPAQRSHVEMMGGEGMRH